MSISDLLGMFVRALAGLARPGARLSPRWSGRAAVAALVRGEDTPVIDACAGPGPKARPDERGFCRATGRASAASARTALIALMACLWASALSAEVYVVPAGEQRAEFACEGEIELDRGRTTMLLPTVRGMTCERVLPIGTRVAVGDAVVSFATRIAERKARERALDFAAAEHEFARREIELAQERAALLAEQASLQGDLATAEAALRSERGGDPDGLALLRAKLVSAEVQAARSARALEIARLRHRSGDLADVDLAAAERASADAAGAVTLAQAEVARAEAGDPLRQAKLAAAVGRLQSKLGLDAGGVPDAAAGILGRIAALDARQKRQRTAAVEQRESSERELHQAERDAWDHTPVQRVELSGPRSTVIAFGPATAPLATGALRDAGDAWSDERGYGWTAGAPLMESRSERPRQAALSLALVRGNAAWRIAVPDGHYTITVVLGDQVDWDGALVRLVAPDGDRGACFVARRIEAGRAQTATVEVDVVGGWLALIFGDGAKALRSPVAGIALPREEVVGGWKVRWILDPAAFVVGPTAMRIRARIHQDLTALLRVGDVNAGDPRAGEPPQDEDPVDQLRRLSALSTLDLLAAGGTRSPATVVSISTQPVALTLRGDDASPNPLDQLGNEIIATIPEAATETLRLGERVRLVAQPPLPAGAVAVPPHLVAFADERWWVQEQGGEPRVVAALRVGGAIVVCAGLAPGMRLVPPQPPPAATARGRLVPGEVVAGVSVPLTVTMAWGRIGSLLEEGAEVTAGQVIVTLYNPRIEDRRDESERLKAQAEAAYHVSVETRQVKNAQTEAAQREQAAAERSARIDAALAALDLPQTLEQAQERARSSEAALAAARDRLARSEAAAIPDQRALDAARSSEASATIVARRARLDLAAAHRAIDWLAVRQAEGLWLDTRSDLAGREGDLVLARAEDRAARLASELLLDQALQGNQLERRFREGRELKARASGRLFYRRGWNDRTRGESIYEKDFWVWPGVTVADIVDIGQLAIQVDLPEDAVSALTAGTTVEIVFPQFNQRRVAAVVDRVSPALVAPRELDRDAAATQPIARRRVAAVKASFTTPADLRGKILPGTKASMVLP